MTEAVLEPIIALVDSATPSEIRALRAFTEAEFKLPDGPRKGDHFDGNWPRWQGEMLEMMADPYWVEFWKTDSRQSGKTLLNFEAPLLFHLFEMKEDVICLVPEMAKAKMIWLKKIEPVISASRYAHLMPKSGKGSRGGGDVDLILFENGASMHFMGAGGADPPSSATARVVVITEANEMRISPTGDQGNPINAVRGCTASFGDRARIYGESIITTMECVTWLQITEVGSDTRPHLRCPYCSCYQFPVRDGLVGWQDAPDAIAAAESARYRCERKECGQLWTEADRKLALDASRLVHKGQSIDDEGVVHGDLPRTRTLGTRGNAMCHPMGTMADIAVKEWRAAKLGTETEEMALCQYTWAVPYVAKTAIEEISLEGLHAVSQRGRHDKTRVPAWAEFLTTTVDVQQDRHYWKTMAHGPDDRWAAVDWGYVGLVKSDDPKPSRAPTPEDRRHVLEEIDALCADGWQVDGTQDRMVPVAKGCDVGYLTAELIDWIKGRPDWYAMRGCGRDDIKGGGPKEEVPEHLLTWLEVTRPQGWSINLHRVNAHNVRTEVHAGLLRDANSAASGELPRGLMHLSGEVWDTSPTKKGKAAYWREARIRHDLLDCAVYGLALGRLWRVILRNIPVVQSAKTWFQKGKRL